MEDLYLEELCKKCNKEQHIQLLKIIVENGLVFTENKNGIFVNYTNLAPTYKQLIKDYLHTLS